jgi:cytosine deaminase
MRRNRADADLMADHGVRCPISPNNILNPFTPLGDGHLIRQAHLCASIVQRATDEDLRATWGTFTASSAKLMRQADDGIAVGNPADLMVVDAPTAIDAVREIAPVLHVFKRGRRTVTRFPAVILRPA